MFPECFLISSLNVPRMLYTGEDTLSANEPDSDWTPNKRDQSVDTRTHIRAKITADVGDDVGENVEEYWDARTVLLLLREERIKHQGANEGPKGANEGPKGANEGPIGANEGPNEGPKGANEGPKGANEGPKGANNRPKGASKGPKGANEGLKRANEGLKRAKKGLSVPRAVCSEPDMAKGRSLSKKRQADDSDGSSSILDCAADHTLRRLAPGCDWSRGTVYS
jgi:hypothetical protein